MTLPGWSEPAADDQLHGELGGGGGPARRQAGYAALRCVTCGVRGRGGGRAGRRRRQLCIFFPWVAAGLQVAVCLCHCHCCCWCLLQGWWCCLEPCSPAASTRSVLNAAQC